MRWMHDGDINRFAGDAPVITDDHPLTEYYPSAPDIQRKG
jgi:hypothetical protein